MGELREKLIKMIRISYLHQNSLIAALSDEEKSAVGYVNDWSPKDVIAHLGYGDAETAAILADLKRGRGDDISAGTDQVNAEIWALYKEASWSDVMALNENAQQDLIAAVDRLADNELTDPNIYEWSNGRPVWQRICFNAYYHRMAHIADLYVRRGQLDKANEIQEESAETQRSLDDSDPWHGNVLYNLGCHYALTGQKTQALSNLGQGFKLFPGIKDWALQDSDLDRLRDDPDFQALFS